MIATKCYHAGMTNSHSNKLKTAVVTGASRGIGRAIALRLGRDGYTVAVHYGSNEQAALDVVSEITAHDGIAFAFGCDLSVDNVGPTFWRQYNQAAQRAGFSTAVHVLVNNAGVTLRGVIEEFSDTDFILQQKINTNAPYFIIRDGLKRLIDGGRIINISSGATRIAFPEIIGYALTKGAIDTLTLTLAQHLGARRITVNAVAPGVVDTDINAGWLRNNQEAMAAVAEDVALGRVGDPNDVANVVSFLASDDASWVTGQVIDATGGTHL